MKAEYVITAVKRNSVSKRNDIVGIWQEEEIRQMIREEINARFPGRPKKCPSMDTDAKDAEASSTSTTNSKTAAKPQNVQTVTGGQRS